MGNKKPGRPKKGNRILGPYRHRNQWRVVVIEGESREIRYFRSKEDAEQVKKDAEYRWYAYSPMIRVADFWEGVTRERMNPTGYVYMMRAGPVGPVKIGYTTDVETRRAKMQSDCPYPLDVVAKIRGTKELERKIHEYFNGCKIGGEWFTPTAAMNDFALLIKNQHSLDQKKIYPNRTPNPQEG